MNTTMLAKDRPERLLDRNELAEYFHVSPRTITNWKNWGWIHPYSGLPPGSHRVLYLLSEVEAEQRRRRMQAA